MATNFINIIVIITFALVGCCCGRNATTRDSEADTPPQKKSFLLEDDSPLYWTGSGGVAGKTIIPYEFYENVPAEIRSKVRALLGEFKTNTCVEWKEVNRNDSSIDLDLVHISMQAYCMAPLGRKTTDPNTVFLHEECLTQDGLLYRMFMHVLGFKHHHTRVDRDQFIKINWNNVDPKCERAFHIHPYNMGDDDGNDGNDGNDVDFDYESVMLANDDLCSKSEGMKTFEPVKPLSPGVVMGQHHVLSATDLARINRRYKCEPVYREEL